MKSLGVSLCWLLLSGALLTPIGFLPAFATLGTSTTISSSQTSSTFGQSVTFTATVSPATATGTMQLLVNGTSFGSPVTISSGQAIFSTSALPVGVDNIAASYSGTNNFSPSTSNSVTILVTSMSSVGGQRGNGTLSSDSNLGHLVSDFVHQRNALLKEQRNETLSIIHECHVEMKTASHGDRKQIHDECKLKLKESREKFKELQKQLKHEFEHLKDQFQSGIKQLHTQQEMDQKNKTQTFNQEISLLQGDAKHFDKGFSKHGENNNTKGKHGHKEKGHSDD